MKSFWKKALMSAAIAALAVGTLSGCGGGDKKGEAPKGNPKEITVYMGVVEKQAKVLADEFKKDTGIEVKFVRMSGGETLSRIRAEKQAPKADAWYGGSADSYIVAANEGLLEAFAENGLNGRVLAEMHVVLAAHWTQVGQCGEVILTFILYYARIACVKLRIVLVEA